MARTIYKYIESKWADAFLKGEIRIRSLSYYRELEAANPLGDPLDGSHLYAPDGGLEITNHTQGWTRIIPNSALKSTLKRLDEILVFCVSLRFDPRLAARFEKDSCIVISDRSAFSKRLRAAMERLVSEPRIFRALPVEYYAKENPPGATWAIPEMILTAKRKDLYSTETEFRFACGPESAFTFEGADYQLMLGDPAGAAASGPLIHREHDIHLGDLSSLCKIHRF